MKRILSWSVLFGLLLSGLGSRANAGPITFYSLFKNIAYEQTSNAQPTTPAGFFVNGAVTSSAVDLLGGLVDGTLVLTASPLPTNNLGWSAGFFPSLNAMNAFFPEGSMHTFSVNTTDVGTLTDTLTLSSNSLFTSNIPFLTNFSALNGMDTSKPFTFMFPGTTATSGSNESATFFSIFGVGSARLTNSATSLTIPGGTLQPNTTYTYELDYSNRLGTPTTGGFSPATAISAYDVRTDGTFTTAASAVPGPSSLALASIALVGLAGYACRSRRRVTA